MIPLTKLVPTRPGLFSRVNPLSLLNATKTPRESEPQEFTVIIRRGTETGALVGTYTFKIMSETAFDKAFDKRSTLRRRKTRADEVHHRRAFCGNCP